MPPSFLTRTELLLGRPALDQLAASRVAVFGLGGVGGHAAEALVRSGVGALDLIDHDIIAESNLNRQVIALRSTLGQSKAEAMKARIHDINPDCAVIAHDCFFDEQDIVPRRFGEFVEGFDAADVDVPAGEFLEDGFATV